MPIDGDRLEAARDEAIDFLATEFLDSRYGVMLSYDDARGLAAMAIDKFIVVARS